MAGDWIKMQGNLWTNPKVVRIMSATKADRCRVIGALFRVWCLFDEHTEDGILQGYTKFLLDDELRIDGFSEAMESVGWLIDNDGESLQVPDFDDHMSKSAKKRAQDTKRKREGRKMSASQADKNTTREEKRREEKNINNSTSVWCSEQREKISGLYNEFTKGKKPKFSKWSQSRIDHLKARCKDKERDLDWWLELIQDIPNHQAAMDGDWFGLDWLLKSEDNLIKFCEGKYKQSFKRGNSNEQKNGGADQFTGHSGFQNIDYGQGVRSDGTF